MRNILILFGLITLSVQIQNCEETEKACSSCIDGYTFFETKYIYGSRCIKSDKVFYGDSQDNCLYYSNSDKTSCRECKKGYIKDHYGDYTCKPAPEHCEEIDGTKCIKCENFFNLTEDGKCEKSTCYEFKDGKCQCDEGFYLFENKECKKIPIKYCGEYDGTSCTECYEGFVKDGKGCKYVGVEDDDDDHKDGEINIPNCSRLDYNDKTKCDHCNENYDWDDAKKECVFLCKTTEDYCVVCNDNYYSFDYGKTCEVIDPDYKDDAKLINFDLMALASLLFLII